MVPIHRLHRTLHGAKASALASARRLVAALVSLATAAALVVVAGVTGVAVADTAPTAGLPATVSADVLPTVQINGVVWAQVTVGNTVYATGQFTQARPAGVAAGGAGTVTRNNLLAYNITTGALITTFNHSLNGIGLTIAASPDGSRVYVGGQFTTVDGASHQRIAAFDTATGALVTSFTASLNNTVRALTASNSAVYVGGAFTAANGTARAYLASYTTAGGLLTWNPGTDFPVYALTMTPDGTGVVAGGGFVTLAGAPAIGMGAVDAITGASRPWAANTVIKDSGTTSRIVGLTADGTQVYGIGFFYTVGGNFEGRFAADPNTGQINWLDNCHGDSYSVFSTGSVIYSAGHSHDCSDIGSYNQDQPTPIPSTHHYVIAESATASGLVNRHPIFPGGNGSPHYSDFAGQPAGTLLNWFPSLTAGTFTGQNQAAWSMTGNGQYVSVGGEFPSINGTGQQGLARFAVSSVAPNKIGPTAAGTLTPLVYSQTPGTARVAWQATSDRDNTTLHYALYRDSGTTPIYQTTVNSTFWDRPNLGFLDTGLAAGSTHSYKVTVTDPFGNAITSGSKSVTIGSASTSPYTATVLADGASNFWPLSESSGAIAADRAGKSDLNLAGAFTLGAAGPLSGNPATAVTFGGGETQPPTPVGANRPPALVPNDTAGTVGQIDPGGAFSLEAWVRTTSTQGGEIVGLGLYKAADSPAIDKAVYLDSAGGIHFGLQANTVKQTVDAAGPYNDGAWHLVNATYAAGGAQLYVDGALVASSNAITDDIAFPGYWRVGGDNLTGWPSAPASNYLAGSIADVAVYPTALSASAVAAHYLAGTSGAVTPNQPPTASFTATCTGLTCAVNGSASQDPDGTIASYAWTFGDGGVATGPTASHTYAGAGSDQITLTVTDNLGAPGSSSQTVNPSVVVSTVLAQDTFGRTVTGGFGTAAPTGGAWTSTYTAADLSVAPGAAKIALPASARAGAYLPAVSSSSVDVVTSLALNKIPVAGNGYYFYAVARRVSSTEQYFVRARVIAGGSVRLSLTKFDGSTSEVTLAPEVAAATLAAGAVLHIRLQATGAGPTTLRAKVWVGAAAEPAAWAVSVTDSSPALQTAGSVGVEGYLSGSVTNGPITGSIAGFTANTL